MIAGTVVALCGGIGGAKLALGLYRVLPPDTLTVVVNTGDDFEHLGLSISPDVDTVLYTLAGLDNPQTGWGRRDETWTFMQVLESLGGESWFRLGDGDLALHVERTRRLTAGETLTRIIADVTARWGVAARVLPMGDQPVRTLIESDGTTLGFQEYFVARKCSPKITSVSFQGLEHAHATEDVLADISASDTRAIVICPSNPYLSIDPLMALPDLRSAVANSDAPVVAVSPIIGGEAVKGPAAKIMMELGLPVSPVTVARHYTGLINGYILDEADSALQSAIDVPALAVQTLMTTLEDKQALAESVLAFAEGLARVSHHDDEPSLDL
ncbi:MAG: 2-phospho-L-lactate transferase [Gammaproteobacteria bacterium]